MGQFTRETVTRLVIPEAYGLIPTTAPTCKTFVMGWYCDTCKKEIDVNEVKTSLALPIHFVLWKGVDTRSGAEVWSQDYHEVVQFVFSSDEEADNWFEQRRLS